MYDTTKALGHKTVYVRLRDYGCGRCPFCGSEVEEKYPSSGHSFQSLGGWMNVITYWYQCNNPDCPSGGKFKAPQPYVLPYKKFGLDVWLFACQEWERFKTSPEEISRRLEYKGVYISDDTIQAIIESYVLLKETHINEETLEAVLKQGFMIIGCDGTPTESGDHALWTFYDVISGRMLYAAYLAHADWKTLRNIFDEIRQNYQVPIKAFLSDHQGSIVKACREYDADIPHQTCHYHFLRNHWNYIEEKDRNMNKKLRKMVNSLPIGRNEPNGGTYYSEGIKVEKRRFFEPLHRHLKKLVNLRNDEFKELKGMRAFESLNQVLDELDEELETLDKGLRPTKQLIVVRTKLKKKLAQLESDYMELIQLNKVFQDIRKVLGDSKMEKDEKSRKLEGIYSNLYEEWKTGAKAAPREKLKSKSANKDMSNAEIFCQWSRLWDSHKEFLFHYMEIEGLEKTNIYNEQLFSLLKSQCIKAHGCANKDYMVLTRGDIYLKDICHKNTLNIQEVLTRYDLKELQVLKQPLQAKKDNARAYFRNSDFLNDSVSFIAEKIRNKAWENENQ